ncbi:hypothetical protein [Amycolatopsis nigrescens]|uniref:hypothetical protein n=1 Tax=Amycolatopsis nigrescens TaxID=381445 RepID=UPI00037CD2E8|nr:hypothetical protein [Amycolatopsis nigrescens]
MRRFAASALLVVALSGTAAAAQPLVATGCASTVRGEPGAEVLLHPAAVAQPVLDVLAKVDPLGVLVPPVREVWSGMPPIPVGVVPAGTGVITGVTIADAVLLRLAEIPVLSPVFGAVAPPLRTVLAASCSIVVEGGPPDAPPPGNPGVPPGRGEPEVPPAAVPPPAAGVPPGTSDGAAPDGDRGPAPEGAGLPPAGISFGYNAGGVPEIGLTVADARQESRNQTRAAGSAEVLPYAGPGGFNRPVLLAALLLTLVATQLLRTWVLRRAKR